jgi:hypothetical protein
MVSPPCSASSAQSVSLRLADSRYAPQAGRPPRTPRRAHSAALATADSGRWRRCWDASGGRGFDALGAPLIANRPAAKPAATSNRPLGEHALAARRPDVVAMLGDWGDSVLNLKLRYYRPLTNSMGGCRAGGRSAEAERAFARRIS